MTLQNLDVVALTEDLPAHGLKQGDLGTIVEVYAPDALEVEFVTASGRRVYQHAPTTLPRAPNCTPSLPRSIPARPEAAVLLPCRECQTRRGASRPASTGAFASPRTSPLFDPSSSCSITASAHPRPLTIPQAAVWCSACWTSRLVTGRTATKSLSPT